MTPAPRTIGQGQPLSDARELMRTLRIRHLPVLDGQKLVGLVSERDLRAFGEPEPRALVIRDVMTSPVYTVGSQSTVREVALHGRTPIRSRRGCRER